MNKNKREIPAGQKESSGCGTDKSRETGSQQRESQRPCFIRNLPSEFLKSQLN